jgi:Helix-turn-helix
LAIVAAVICTPAVKVPTGTAVSPSCSREGSAGVSLKPRKSNAIDGVTRQTVNAIELGKYSPSLEAAFRIAAVFDKPLESVFHYSKD